MFNGTFEDIVAKDDGFLRGPFGSALKKSLFVPKSEDTYKVYEQGVVLEKNSNIGRYYISKDYYENNMIRFTVKPGDFLVSCSGVNYGAIYQLPDKIEPGIINQALLRIRLNNYIVDENYFLYYFRAYIVNVITGGTGDSTIPNFPPMSVVRSVKIQLPSMEVQKKVGKFLRNIEEKINKNNKIINEMEQMAKTIYDYWFLQYEFPNEEGKPYKSSGEKMVYCEEMKKEIPEGWKVGYLKNYIDKDKGGDWGKEFKESNYNERVICLRGADFPSICGQEEVKAPERYILEKNLNKSLENGDLIIEISGGSPSQSTGRICYINSNTLKRFDLPIITSNFCKAISLKNKEYLYWFYIQWLKLYESNIFFKYEGKTTGIKNLLFDMLCTDYKIIEPPENLIKKYNSLVSIYFDNIQKNKKENEELIKLRDYLLPLFMNGQVGFKS